MKIDDLGVRRSAGVVRVEATVSWEQADREPFRIFFDTEERFADQFGADPNALVMACALPAWRDGEQRISLEGPVCPLLARNLEAVYARVRRWYPGEFGPPPRLEPSMGFAVRTPAVGRSLALLSCGVDSLASVRWNMLHIPRDHERSIGGLSFVAFDGYPAQSLARLHESCDGRRDAVDSIAAEIGADVLPIRTNSWWLAEDGVFFDEKWHGAAYTSAVALFSAAYHRVYIAAGQDPWVDVPWGSHPALDPNYSSAHLAIEHDLVWSRFDKTRLVGEWVVGRDNIRVCQNESSGSRNCGTCEKCIRTSLTLLVQGLLVTRALRGEISADVVELLDEYRMISPLPGFLEYYDALVPALRSVDRDDLADALREVLSRTRRRHGLPDQDAVPDSEVDALVDEPSDLSAAGAARQETQR